MKISLINAGKRFNREWIFRRINFEFYSGKAYAITGPNGSGKSTLLQSLAGIMQLSEGEMHYAGIKDDDQYGSMSFAAPYADVIEEMNLTEFFHFHSQFKKLNSATTIDSIIEEIGLKSAAHKQIRYYSSGMKQRVRLAQAVYSDTPVLLLDEPTSNFDEEGIRLYHRLIQKYSGNRLVVICSNDPGEYGFCQEKINIADYK
jgi:ABC-type multidrug transport system ATPase subunit